MRTELRNNGDGFEKLASSALRKITAVGDALTFFTPEKPRSEALAAFWYAEKAPAAPKKSAKTPAAAPQNKRQSPAKPAAAERDTAADDYTF